MSFSCLKTLQELGTPSFILQRRSVAIGEAGSLKSHLSVWRYRPKHSIYAHVLCHGQARGCGKSRGRASRECTENILLQAPWGRLPGHTLLCCRDKGDLGPQICPHLERTSLETCYFFPLIKTLYWDTRNDRFFFSSTVAVCIYSCSSM